MISENIPGIWRTGNMIHRMCLRRYYLVQLITVSYETFNLFKHLKWDCFVTGNKGHCSIISLNHPLPQLIFTRVEATAERRQDWGFWIVLSFLFCQGLSAWRLWRVISADTRSQLHTHLYFSQSLDQMCHSQVHFLLHELIYKWGDKQPFTLTFTPKVNSKLLLRNMFQYIFMIQFMKEKKLFLYISFIQF